MAKYPAYKYCVPGIFTSKSGEPRNIFTLGCGLVASWRGRGVAMAGARHLEETQEAWGVTRCAGLSGEALDGRSIGRVGRVLGVRRET